MAKETQVMAMDGLRGYLLLASGLADMSMAKATEAASALLSLSSGLTGGRSSSTVQLQVQDLAEELLAAAAANRRSLIALVRNEVERAVARSPIPPDELNRARAAVAKLSADVEALQAQILTNPAVGEVAGKLGLAGHTVSRPADEGVVVDAAFTSPVDEPVPAAPRRRPPRKQIADRASTRPVATDAGDGGAERPTKSFAAPTEPAVTTTTTAPAKTAATTGGAPAKKAATNKAATNKAATNKAATKRAAPAKKAATTTVAPTTTAPAKKAATKKAASKKAAPAKRAATTTVAPTTTAPAKKAATKKAANKKAAPAKNAATTTTARPAKKAAKRTTSTAAAPARPSGAVTTKKAAKRTTSTAAAPARPSGAVTTKKAPTATSAATRSPAKKSAAKKSAAKKSAARPATTPATGSGA
ncbi:MAG: hypothetical protein ACHP7G_07445 [Actinomycetales bacterium]